MIYHVIREIILLSLIRYGLLLPLPLNEHAYMIARAAIKQHDRGIQAQNKLSAREKVVNLYLEYLQSEEYRKTKNFFYPSRPIETVLKNITSSPFYRFLLRLPKGGNLHLHESQVLDRRILLESIQNSPEYDLLHICDHPTCHDKRFFLQYHKTNVSSIWTKVKGSNWTIDEILKRTTLIGILNHLPEPIYATDISGRWNITAQYRIFSFYDDLIRHNTTRFKYLQLVLDQALDENIQLLELRRRLFGRSYYFAENGSKVLIDANEELQMLSRFRDEYLRRNPTFIDYTYILYSLRKSSKEKIKSELNYTISLQQMYPDLIRGYDMVGEEDEGHTLLYHSDVLIHGFNYSRMSGGTFDYLFHAGETNWPQDYFPSNYGDAVSTFENIYDALVFRSRRIGHGISLAKRPDIYEYLRQQDIAIEICPSSNQILGYVADLRNHPGIVFHRSGIPIVLAGDDPGSFGYNQLTVDFYLATMAWGLNLADIKQFAWNSIQYSSLPETRKRIGLMKWQKRWQFFIDSMYRFSCRQTFSEITLNISNILPSYGPFDQSMNVTLYGIGYEKAICKPIICLFGTAKTLGTLVDINEITCPTPTGKNPLSVVSISLIIGDERISTGYHYRYLPYVEIINDGTLNGTITLSKADATRISQWPWIIGVFFHLIYSFLKNKVDSLIYTDSSH